MPNSIPTPRDQAPYITHKPKQLPPWCMSQAKGLLQAAPEESNYLGSGLTLPINCMFIGFPWVTPN